VNYEVDEVVPALLPLWHALAQTIQERTRTETMTSAFSHYLKQPIDSPEHRQFRADLWLGGSEFTCRYYLSLLVRRDLSDMPGSDFLSLLREYITDHTCAAAAQFCVTEGHLQFVLPFLKLQCGDDTERLSKEERALVLLVQHPDWADDRIREAVGTTENAMKRWTTFNYARIAQTHYRNGCPGWC
jgi:hypothetical protein